MLLLRMTWFVLTLVTNRWHDLFLVVCVVWCRSYLSQVRGYSDQCGAILSDISDATEQLQRLRLQYGHVSTRTGALHAACEQLLADQTRLVGTAESISEKLVFFDELETISHVSLSCCCT